MVVTKVLVDGDREAGIGWDQQQAMEVKAAVAEDERGRPRILLVDRQVGSPDEERKIVGRSGPRLPMRPRNERRVDPLEFALHRLDDCATRTRKSNEGKRQQVTGPPIIRPADDQLGVAVHLLSGDLIDSADPIKFVDLRLGLD